MTPEQVDRVFGRGRLKMVTGEHVEVFREAVVPGERRRYTKRFLNSTDGDFGHWTEREWKILARLIGHGIGCVPDVVQFDRGSAKGAQLVQTYDAGVTVDQWATLLPLERDGHVYRHAFEDCAHWFALAHYCLKALKDIHELDLVHLDIKGDNVCIPFGPATFDPEARGAQLYPLFSQLALIDFAFSLVSGESLTVALPIGWQREYDYQSPRLIEALSEGHDGDLTKTRKLDWRCDFYSLAAMLKRYLPSEIATHPRGRATGWTSERYGAAKALIVSLRHHHDGELPQRLPHQWMIDITGTMLKEADLAQSLAAGWTLARDATLAAGLASPLTPMTRIAPPVRVFRKPRERTKEQWQERRQHGSDAQDAQSGEPVLPEKRTPALAFAAPTDLRVARMAREDIGASMQPAAKRVDDGRQPEVRRAYATIASIAAVMALALGAAVAHQLYPDATNGAIASARSWFGNRDVGSSPGRSSAAEPIAGSSAPTPDAPATANSAVEPATNVATAAPEPSPVAPPSTPVPETTAMSDTRAAARDDRIDEPPDAVNADSTDPIPASKTRADPPVAASGARATPRTASPVTESSPRAASKRQSAKTAPAVPSGRPSPPAIPQTATARTAPNRYAMATPRASTASASSQKPGAASTPASSEGARVETAAAPPVHVIELAPPSNQLAPPDPAPSQASPERIASSNPSPTPEPAAVPQPSAPPKSSVQRRSRPLAADEEWRAGLNALAQFFGFGKRNAAPVEDRGIAEATPPRSSRVPQAPTLAQNNAVPVLPKSDVQPLATPPAPVSTTPRVDTPPPPPIVAPPLVSRIGESPPLLAEARSDFRGSERTREHDYAREARRALQQSVPRIAQQTQYEIAPVLSAAAKAQDPRLERDVIDSAQAVWVGETAAALPQWGEAAAAKRLNDEAMRAYWVRRNIPEAFDLSLKAFGANPNDPEVVGNLAFLHLRMTPSQPEMARQLALQAIAVRGPRFRTGRLEDWNTYALASALTGRDVDARNAMYVTVALAGSVERNCKAALTAMANYGERVREAVEAMLYRIHAQGRAHDSPYCAWPPNRSSVGMRRQ